MLNKPYFQSDKNKIKIVKLSQIGFCDKVQSSFEIT